jgi:hypothetical protein
MIEARNRVAQGLHAYSTGLLNGEVIGLMQHASPLCVPWKWIQGTIPAQQSARCASGRSGGVAPCRWQQGVWVVDFS